MRAEMGKWTVISGMTVFLLLHGTAWESQASNVPSPMVMIKSSSDKVLQLLKDPQLGKDPRAMEERLWEVISKRFDFWEMSKRTLALHWRKRTREEREEFVRLFSHLLFKSYIDKMNQYTDERIIYEKEIIRGKRALVKTLVLGKGMEVEIDYKMILRSNEWRIYDVVIEGVSLVSNYRTQFHKIVTSSGYEELLNRLKKKHEELERERQQSIKETSN